MKIRNGFVSNSSSASYIVTLNKPFESMDALLLDVYDSCWPAIAESEDDYFARQELWERREGEVTRTTILTSPFDSFVQERPPRERVTTVDQRSRYIDNEANRIEAMRRVMDYEGIEIRPLLTQKWQLVYYTSMHNSFHDMSHLLKDIFLEYLIHGGGCDLKFESDN